MGKAELISARGFAGANPAADDERWMSAALGQARIAEGRTHPNPAVGCVIVKDGTLIGAGHTGDGGRPHAEAIALKDAGSNAKGATAYVTLEPCNHHGKTPPCTAALIQSGCSRVVAGMQDPDEKVAGSGMAALADANIKIESGALGDEVAEFYRGYTMQRTKGRPLVTVKLATSLDGKIALGSGASKWITSDAARAYVHEMRSRHDAVMTSAATYRSDNPLLTCRLKGYDGPQPLRVVVSKKQVIAAKSNVAKTADKKKSPVLHLHSGNVKKVGAIENKKIPADKNGRPDLAAALTALGKRGITSVLVEAGGRFAAALLAANLVDRLVWMRSASVIGDDGISSLGKLGLGAIAEGKIFTRTALYAIGDDTVEELQRN